MVEITGREYKAMINHLPFRSRERAVRGFNRDLLGTVAMVVILVLSGAPELGRAASSRLPHSSGDSAYAEEQRRRLPDRHLTVEPKLKLPAVELLPLVNLRVEDVWIDQTMVEAGVVPQVTINFRILNNGVATVNGPFRTSIGLPGNVRFVTSGRLPSGGSLYVSQTVSFPSSGSRQFTVTVDVDGDVAETSESDNRVTIDCNVGAPPIGQWYSIGPRKIDQDPGAVGVLFTVAVDPSNPSNPANLYVGGPSGSGLWNSTDAGASWRPIAQNLPTRLNQALAIDPTNGSRLYVSTATGVFRSDDAGQSWRQIASLGDILKGDLLIDPTSPSTLYLTGIDGIYRSFDSGETWGNLTPTPVLRILGTDGVAARPVDLVMERDNPRWLYASLVHGSDPSVTGVWESSDGGTNWRRMVGCPGGYLPSFPAGTAIRLALSGGTLYVGYQTGGSYALYRTSGIGCIGGQGQQRQFERRNFAPSASNAAMMWSGMYADPADARYVYVTGRVFWRSTDGGNTFTSLVGGHVDHQGFAFHPNDSRILYAVNDGGVFRSADRGATWRFIGTGIANVQFYDIGNAERSPSRVVGGTQDNGTVYTDRSTTWKEWATGDGLIVDVDPRDPSVIYGMNQYSAELQRFDSDPRTSVCIGCGLPLGTACGSCQGFCLNFHFQVDPISPQVLLACCMSLWRAVNPQACAVCPGGSNPGSPLQWQAIFTPPTGTQIMHAAVDPATGVYYGGSNNGRLYAARRGSELTSANWRQIYPAGGTTGAWVTDVEVDEWDPSRVFFTTGGTAAGRVVLVRRSFNGNLVSGNGTDITANLPAGIQVSTVAIDPHRSLTVYLGTTAGVYRGTSSTGTSWTWLPYNAGIPTSLWVRELTFHPVTGLLRAGTWGRGALEVATDHRLGSLLVASGRISLLRVHDVGTGYGPPTDRLDVECIVQLNTAPDKAFGFQLRQGITEPEQSGMLDTLRDTFRRNESITLDYIRTGIRTGRIVRAARP